MNLFHKKTKPIPIPDGFTPESIRMESSTCTGETTIGFYSTAEKRLCFAELVRNEDDVDAFYVKYGLLRKS